MSTSVPAGKLIKGSATGEQALHRVGEGHLDLTSLENIIQKSGVFFQFSLKLNFEKGWDFEL